MSLRNIEYHNHHIVVVDNGSTDSSILWLEQEFPETTFIRNPENYGFAKGNNVGIRFALERNAEYVLLLNNDTIVTPKFLNYLIETAESDMSVGIVTGKILCHDNPHKIWSAGGTLRLYRAGVKSFKTNQTDRNIYDVTFTPGCMMLIKCSLINSLGLLDERYFFGVEDWEFCYRVIKNGWKIRVNLEAEIFHKEGSIKRESPFRVYNSTYNRLVFISDLPILQRIIAISYFILTRPLRCLIWCMDGKSDLARESIKAIINFLKTKYE